MDTPVCLPSGEAISVIDALTRAAHRYVRHLEPAPAGSRDSAHMAFVGGVIDALCDEIYQQEGAADWVAYVYALLDGCGNDSLDQSQSIRLAAADINNESHYARGRSDAAAAIAGLGLPVARDAGRNSIRSS